jgi:hypothetical protein
MQFTGQKDKQYEDHEKDHALNSDYNYSFILQSAISPSAQSRSSLEKTRRTCQL